MLRQKSGMTCVATMDGKEVIPRAMRFGAFLNNLSTMDPRRDFRLFASFLSFDAAALPPFTSVVVEPDASPPSDLLLEHPIVIVYIYTLLCVG